jgi:class 3 adenylate cyclase
MPERKLLLQTDSPESWVDVVNERLSPDVASSRRLTKARRSRLLEGFSALAGRGRDPADALDPELLSWLELIGLDPREWEATTREVAEIVDRGQSAGLDRAALPHVLQAYVRAVGRIAAVEAGIARDTLRSADPESRAEVIGRLIDVLLPTSVRGFDMLHKALLQDALLEASDGLDADDSELENLAIGMVDLVRSTDYLSTASSEDLEQLVDAIFRAGQRATSGRTAHVVKYVGDGAFIAGNVVESVADTALEMVARLEDILPLRARGGISYGFVVQRAGDIFGLPVNASQALTKAAKPGTILLTAGAAACLPKDRCGRLRTRRLPHPALGEQRVATLKPSAERRSDQPQLTAPASKP